jgi:hypothetical protein
MVYQLSEKNQILVALFAIIILSSAKLFKDYLFRKRYVEGMQVTTETSTQLRRNATGGANVTAEVYLFVTLERDLLSSQTLQLSLAGSSANDVTISESTGDYRASVVSGTTNATLSSSGSSASITFTPSATINAGSMIKITVGGITIYPGSKADSKLTSTITIGNGETSVSRDFKILASESSSSNQYVNPVGATSSEIQTAINDINTRLNATPAIGDAERTNLLKARSALVTLLASTYGTVKEAGQVFDSDALFEAQRTAMDFIKKEKARAANNANALKEDNSNKRRMAQINTYYTKNYEANTEVMKNIIYVSIALIFLAVLRNKELIPASIGTLGVIFVLTLGGIVIGKQVFDIMRRNDHDFDKYDWVFNEDELNRKQLIQQNSDPANLSEMGMGMAPCYGPGCCDVGTSWDENAKKCIPGAGGRISGSAVWAASGSSLTLKLTVTNALSANDTISVELPSGLFSGTPALSSNAVLSGTSLTSGMSVFTIAPSQTVPAGGSIPDIVLTGLTVQPNSYSMSRQLKVKTSKDINDVGINITGI